MMLTKWNGHLSVWDLLRRQHEPTVMMQVCEEPLLRVRAHEGVRQHTFHLVLQTKFLCRNSN